MTLKRQQRLRIMSLKDGEIPMMNLKNTINFKTLREKGPSAIEVENDEVVQVVSRSSDIKVVVTQDYFLKLLSAYNNFLTHSGHKEEEVIEVDFEKRLDSLEKRFQKISKLTNDDEGSSKWQDGQKKVGQA